MVQKTTVLKKEQIDRRWYVVDAKGRTLGRLASKVASMLRGKNKPGYSPHLDTGDFIIVVNASDVHVTGNKRQDKKYWRHTNYPGGIRINSFEEMMGKDPTFAVRNAVKGMLPHNRLGRRLLKKLKVYAGSEHPHRAQNPETIEL